MEQIEGRLRVSLIQETMVPHDHGETSSNSAIVDDDTTPRLSTFPISRKSPPVKRNPTVPFQLFGTSIHIPDDKNQTLSLSPPGSSDNDRNQVEDDVSTVSGVICYAVPLRWLLVPYCNGVDSKKKRKQIQGDVNQRLKHRRVVDDEHQGPSVPIEQIPGLMQTLELRGGKGAVFLYRKKLELSDVGKEQHRLFVTRKERVMEFLREEEVGEVEGHGRGMKMTAVDGGGEVYQNMGLTKWGSLNILVINSDWTKMVIKNNAQKGDVVEIWGYREAHKPCLAFNFIHAPPL